MGALYYALERATSFEESAKNDGRQKSLTRSCPHFPKSAICGRSGDGHDLHGRVHQEKDSSLPTNQHLPHVEARVFVQALLELLNAVALPHHDALHRLVAHLPKASLGS